MDNLEWETKYATYYKDSKGNKVMFDPYIRKDVGSMCWERSDGQRIGGEYKTRISGKDFYIGWGNKEYLFRATAVGFDLLGSESVCYSFTKIA